MRVEIEPSAPPVLADHEFRGTLDPASDGNIVFVPNGFADLPRSIGDALPVCDHCGQVTRRKPLYVLQCLTTSTLRKIGQNCLAQEFSPADAHRLVTWVADYKALLHTIRESMPCEGRTHFAVVEVVAAAIDVIAVRGWVSRGEAHKTGARATAEWVQDVLQYACYPEQRTSDEFKALLADIGGLSQTSDSTDQAALVVEWLTRLHANEDADHTLTDYLHNLSTVASLRYVTLRHVGLLASAPVAYQNQCEYEARVAARPTQDKGKHWGVVKERADADIHVESIVQKPDNEFGPCYLVSMHVRGTGEKLSWWTGENCWVEPGKDYTVRMTPKSHGEWDGYNVTTVSHVSEYERPAPKVKKPRKAKS